MEKKIGIAVEATYGEGASEHSEAIKTDITKSKPIRASKHLICSARFNCPCCGKPIVIEIDSDEIVAAGQQ